MKDIESILTLFGVTPTPVRKLVYKCLRESTSPLSLSDLEVRLGTVDKSTISRTLAIFKEHNLLHSFTDGSGSQKYETSGTEDPSQQEKGHLHFRCEECGETICLPNIDVPIVELPEGYIAKEVNYVITGICGDCTKSKNKQL